MLCDCVSRCLRRLTLRRVGAKAISQATITAEPGGEGYIPFDVDPSIFEQFAPKREGVETTYNGKLCYTPVFAVFGRERFCINHWLLPGREKAVERIDDFIRESMDLLPATVAKNKILCRYDAGLYSIKTVKASEEAGAYYLVKARTSAALDRMVNQNLDIDVLDLKVTKFGGEYFGEFEYMPDGWKTPRRFVFCVQIKGEDGKGQKFLINDCCLPHPGHQSPQTGHSSAGVRTISGPWSGGRGEQGTEA